MKTKSAFPAALIVGLSILHLPRVFGQGDLTPPPGPPSPTMKTLDQVEARIIVNATNTPGDAANTFIISAPGSYYLTGNITGTPGVNGISIQANDVTLDLNGFALISGGGGNFRGVNVPAVQTGFSIRNGSVRGWTDGGVRADNATTLAEKVRVTDNTNATGLTVGNGSLVRDCVATANKTGFSAADRTQLSNCIATVNTEVGFVGGGFVSLLDCTSSRNGYTGIVVQGTSSVIHCTATRNGTATANPNSPFHGIVTGTGCTVSDCTAGSNVVNGINVDSGTTVRNCTLYANGNLGILATSDCHIVGNSSNSNNGGIHATGGGNRVDGNSCSANTIVGVQVTGDGNLVIRNSAHGSGLNFSINMGINAVGPIVDMTAAGVITSTSPWANFSY